MQNTQNAYDITISQLAEDLLLLDDVSKIKEGLQKIQEIAIKSYKILYTALEDGDISTLFDVKEML